MLRGRFLFCFGQLLIEFHQFGHTGTFTGPGFGARHELLVETNKLEVFADIAAWLDKQLTKQ